jgi:hypothetical protein
MKGVLHRQTEAVCRRQQVLTKDHPQNTCWPLEDVSPSKLPLITAALRSFNEKRGSTGRVSQPRGRLRHGGSCVPRTSRDFKVAMWLKRPEDAFSSEAGFWPRNSLRRPINQSVSGCSDVRPVRENSFPECSFRYPRYLHSRIACPPVWSVHTRAQARYPRRPRCNSTPGHPHRPDPQKAAVLIGNCHGLRFPTGIATTLQFGPKELQY